MKKDSLAGSAALPAARDAGGHPSHLGLLYILTLYFVARLAVILVSAALYASQFGFVLGRKMWPYAILFVADLVFLVLFIYWPWLRARLGRWYLPCAMVIASAIPIIEARYLYGLYGDIPGAQLWLVFPFLSVPLIIVAWQYHYREVLLYCMGTAAFELAMQVLLPGPGRVNDLISIWLVVPRTVFFILMGQIVSDLVGEQRSQQRELAEANRALLRNAAALEQLATSRERNRLARELHDTLAHTLSGLAVQLQAISAVWDTNPSRARAMLEHAVEATGAGLDETRRALSDLRAAPLDDLGLGLAVRALAKGVASRSGLALDLDVPEQLGELAGEIEQCYYRVAQEALENVVRHAGARHVRVSLRWLAGELLLEIADDGRGLTEGPAPQQFGLRGMRERAEMIGATLEVNSGPEQGTNIRLSKRIVA